MKGWVYVISNKAMPNIVKIGYSLKDPELRAAELNHTGSPYPYIVDYEILVEEPRDIEHKVHVRLRDRREGKEWFSCSVEDAIAAIKLVVGSNAAQVENFKRADREKAEAKQQEEAEAMRWYRLATEQGLAEAQNKLGVMYFYGRGVVQNYAEAVRWFRQAAEQGHAEAQTSLGVMYAEGQGVVQNYAEAVRWYRLAAEQGHAEAQFGMGVMYAYGQGVAQDDAEAVRWYRLAAAQGYALAQDELRRLNQAC